jgi:hypothetical protein
VQDARSNLRKRRTGVCHRCGWRGYVGKVRRRDSRCIQSGNANGRLYDECAAALLHGEAAVSNPDESRHVRLTVVRKKDVA